MVHVSLPKIGTDGQCYVPRTDLLHPMFTKRKSIAQHQLTLLEQKHAETVAILEKAFRIRCFFKGNKHGKKERRENWKDVNLSFRRSRNERRKKFCLSIFMKKKKSVCASDLKDSSFYNDRLPFFFIAILILISNEKIHNYGPHIHLRSAQSNVFNQKSRENWKKKKKKN